MSRTARTMGPDERELLAAAVALISDPHQSVARAGMLIDIMADRLERVDRLISTELTAVAFAAEDIVEARRAGPTWDARRRLARAVHNYFLRTLVHEPVRNGQQHERA